jgi:hypothetical protein
MDTFLKQPTKDSKKRTGQKSKAKKPPKDGTVEHLTADDPSFAVSVLSAAIEIPLEKIARSLKSFNHHSTDGQIALQLFTPPDGYPVNIESAGLASSLDAIATALARIAAALEAR